MKDNGEQVFLFVSALRFVAVLERKASRKKLFLFILSVASNPVTMDSPELTNNLC